MADKTNDAIDKGMIRVLVYGTLKKGHSNHVLLEEAKAVFLGFESVTGGYQMWDLGAIPAVVPSETGERKIRGELWAMNPEGLAALDLLEGHPHLYKRSKVWTDIHQKRAWMYMLNATNYLGEHCTPTKAQLWHGSPEENKFWLKQGKAA